MLQTLFSMQGRINRAAFWGVSFGWLAAFVAVGGAVALTGVSGDDLNAAGYVGATLLLVMFFAALWSGLCISVRRYHDLGKSGVWVLIYAVPVVGPVWYFVETGCFRGEAGDNRFGPDPLNRLAANAFARA